MGGRDELNAYIEKKMAELPLSSFGTKREDETQTQFAVRQLHNTTILQAMAAIEFGVEPYDQYDQFDLGMMAAWHAIKALLKD